MSEFNIQFLTQAINLRRHLGPLIGSEPSISFSPEGAAQLSFNLTKEQVAEIGSKTMLVPHRYEWEELWVYHLEAQFTASQKENYGDAEEHKQRAEKIRKMLDDQKAS